ncbi:MAG: virulence protein SciE type [Pseudomonadales bacterium]|nr:virulence protein SciE type [Pseudomonadales bacterium]
MRAEELIKTGQVKEALAALTEEVRNNPSDAPLRTFLFQLLCIDGQYQRALTQLTVVQELDTITMAMAKTYQQVIQCEMLREAIYKGEKTPLIFGEPSAWVAPLLESLKLEGQGHSAKAEAMRQGAYEDIPTVSGSINGESFEWIADADSRTGPFMEGIIDGRYFWIPFQCIAHIKISEPEDLRDLIWLPCEFHWTNGGDAVGFIPARYPESGRDEDPLIQLGRKTDWVQLGEQSYAGRGQKLLTTDENDYPLLSVREITLTQQT